MRYIAAALLLAPALALAEAEIPLVVANNREAWVFVVTPSQATARLVSRHEKRQDELWPVAVASAFRDQRDRSTRQAQAARLEGPQWVSPSPDCENLSLGHAPTPISLVNRVEYGKGKQWSPDGEVQVASSSYVADVQWSSDSRYLLIVESESRDSISPMGLLGRLAGHPIALHTFYVLSIDMKTGEKKRLELVAGVRQGEAAFPGNQTECGQR